MKILFINPSLRLGSPTKVLPVGLALIMTFVEERGYSFDLLDIDINDLEDYQVEDYIDKNDYDVVLFGCIVTHYKWSKWFTKIVRKHLPKAKIIVGNSVGGSIPDVFLTNTEADIVVIGEGEFTTVEILDAVKNVSDLSLIQGIAFKNEKGEIVKNTRRKALKKLDEFPFINWDHFDVEAYFKKSYMAATGEVFDEGAEPRAMPVVTARGCVFKCTFCHYVFWDDPYRYRSPENVLEEIQSYITKYQTTYINFWDDLSFGSLPQAERMVDAIIESGVVFKWSAAVRVDLFGNPKYPYEHRMALAHKFKKAGCMSLGFSLESGNQEILDMMEKRIEPEYFSDQVEILKNAGITSNVSVVFGYPIETKETIQETFEMCLNAKIYPSIGFLLPLPSTGMYTYALTEGLITDEDAFLDSITERQDLCLNMTKMDDEEVQYYIAEGAKNLNEMLDLGLTAGTLIKTGGYRNQAQKTAKGSNPYAPIDPDDMKRTENDFSLNYNQAIFDMDANADG